MSVVAQNNPSGSIAPAAVFSSPKGGSPFRPSWRVGAFTVKFIHTAVFWLIAVCVAHTFVSGVRNRPNRWTVPAISVVLVESAVFAGNGWRCPLTGLAERLGAESGRVTDILLPRWIADRIPQIFTPPFVVGLLALLWHRLPARSGSQS